MFFAKKGEIPPSVFYHDPKIYDRDGNTVAILLLKKGKEVPKEWKYDPKYKIENLNYDKNYSSTTAYILADNEIIPPDYFEHDPTIIDGKYGMTVAHALASKGIEPPR